MPSFMAVSLIFLLFTAVAVPAVYCTSRTNAAPFAILPYLVLLAGLTLHYVGLWSADEGVGGGGFAKGVTENRDASPLCQEALARSAEGGLILGRPDAGRVVVNGALWAQLPQQAKDGLVSCIAGGRPGSTAARSIRIIESAPKQMSGR